MQKGAQREITSCMIIAKLYTSAAYVPFSLGSRMISGAVQNWSVPNIQRSESIRKTEYIYIKKEEEMVGTSMSCFSSHGLAICTCITRTLWFGVLQDDVLTVDDFTEAVIRNLQNKPTIYHTVPWLQASMNNPTIMQVLHSLTGKDKKKALEGKWQRSMRWEQVTSLTVH